MSKMLGKSRTMRVLGMTSTGIAIRPITGSEESEEERKRREAKEKETGGGSGSNEGGGDGASGSSDGGNSGSDEGGDDANGTREGNYPNESDTDRWRRRAEAADRSKGELERELNKLRDKDKSELERATSTIKDQEVQIRQLTEQRDDAIIQGEILKHPGYTWQDPDALLKLIDRSEIAIDKEGKVTGVKDVIKKMAESKPWLLKKNEPTEPKPQQQAGKQQVQPASGGTPSNGSKPDDKNDQRDALSRKYKLNTYM